MVNRLASETSPYLLQHAHNPVDWYPWGREALDRARVEDRPILLSIGYSACHWCHVMERESFENPGTAALMNESFINIKVDREERPDLDGIYMQAVQAMTGSGGWPMTVFLTPDGTPFYGGTYYPPADRGTTPGFPRVLTSIAHAWQNRRAEIQESGTQLRQHLQQTLQPGPAGGDLTVDILDDASRALIAQHDPEFGGLGGTPKFPQPMGLEFLLRIWRRTGSESALNVVLHTLDQMARGGIYDHLGGGFARYSTDAEWLVPHFEKMLYDNAQLARIYLLAYQATGRPALRLVVEETLGYILGDMTDPGGGIYSTEDADSEGEEGKFYVWQPAEVLQLLGDPEARIFSAYYDIHEPGNFERKASILHVDEPAAAVAARLGIDELELAAVIDRGRQVLFAARARRVRPARDEKVLAAWNGLLLRTLAEAGRVLDRADYTAAAVRNADFLVREMRQPDGGLYRTWKPGHAARLNGYLEDYANVADGLTALYEATFDQRWLATATELAQVMLDRFADTERGGFFDTSTTHETLITRPKDLFDNATPSGNAVAADVLLRLAVLTDNAAFRAAAEGTLRVVREPMSRYPLGFGRYLCALDFLLAEPKEVAIVGDAPAALLRVIFEPYLPNKVVAGGAARIPLLADRPAVDGRATAYVCEHYVCQAPTTDPEVLRALLHP